MCTLRLPPNSPFHDLRGPPRRSQLLAKQVVCLEACKMLHTLGHVTDYLLPVNEEEKVEEAESMNLSTTKNRGAGKSLTFSTT